MSIVTVSASAHLDDDTPIGVLSQDHCQVLQIGHILPRVDIYVGTLKQARQLEEAIAKIVATFHSRESDWIDDDSDVISRGSCPGPDRAS